MVNHEWVRVKLAPWSHRANETIIESEASLGRAACAVLVYVVKMTKL